MDPTTYILEAEALIDNIHEIKQWVYDGSIRLLVPLCTLEHVEKASKAVTAQKEVQKDTTTGRPSGRAARKEQPLFDINPRTTWEFLSRAKSEKGEEGVKLQEENEEFTQWKEEDEKAIEKEKAAVTPTAPTSFADALLRKLNMKDDSDSDSAKVPPKPRLIPRSNEPKSPWKYHKIPTVSSRGIIPASKPLYSYALWRIYELEKNPLQQQETVMLLVKTKTAQAAAEKLGISTALMMEIRSSIYVAKSKSDHRLRSGELEATFPESAISSATNGASNEVQQSVNGNLEVISNDIINEVKESKKAVKLQEEKPRTGSSPNHDPDDMLQNVRGKALNGTQPATEDAPAIQVKSPVEAPHEGLSQKTSLAISKSPSEKSIQTATPLLMNGENGFPYPVQLSRSSTASGEKKGEESELDSDEEIIVFNPRARRTSGRKQMDTQRSRPSTSSGQPPKILKSSPKSIVDRPSSSSKNGTTSNDITRDLKNIVEAIESIAASIEKPVAAVEKLKPKIESSLKAESPVFTPGKPFIPNSQQPKSEPRSTPPPPPPPEPVKSSLPKSPAIPTNPRNALPRQPRIAMQQLNASQEHLQQQRENQQRESERMIQRQREAIQRRARVIERAPRKIEEKVEEAVVEKPPPRQIQMEPTDNPTVIDPDAFDRSYVVQPSTSSPNTTNSSAEKRRSKGNQTHARGGGIKRNQGSPRCKETPEPEVEYVLKSGAPRGSIRGKGKLWVP